MMVENVDVNGIEMSYARFGSGEKIFVIIPGLNAEKLIPKARATERAYKKIAVDHTVYLFDRRDNVPEGYSIHDIADDTAAVMKSLGIEKACLFGTSQGGMIAMDMAINHPELISGLVLNSTCEYVNEYLTEALKVWRETAESGDSRALNAAIVDRMFSEGFLKKNRDALLSVMKPYPEDTLKSFIKAIDSFKDFDLRGRLDAVSCPRCVFGAGKDLVMGGQSAKQLAEALGCEYYVYTDYGHCVYDEVPDYLDRVVDFLDRNNL